jgi:uncharacterized membrane protein
MADEGRQADTESQPGQDKVDGSGGVVTGKAAEGLKSAADAVPGDLKEVMRDAGRAVTNEIKTAIAEAAAESLAPAARKATTSALTYATTKGPELVQGVVRDTVAPKLKEAGGAKALAGTALARFPGAISKVPGALSKIPGAGGLGSMLGTGGRGGGGGGGGGDELKGVGRGRRLPMQAAIDVSVPVEVAYDQWTQFEEFPKFMFRVERIEQKDETHLIWHEKIWGIRRQWEAEIVEQRPNERILWRSTSGPQNVGVINFHQLHDPRLTRIQVNLDFQPTGIIEKTGSGWRAAIRALDTDLKRFKAYVEMKDAATGAWKGRIKDAELQSEEGEDQAAEDQGDQGQEQAAAGQGEEQASADQAQDQDQDQRQEQFADEPPEEQSATGQGRQAPRGESSASGGRDASGNGQASAADATDEDVESEDEEEPEPVVQRRRGKG